MLGKAGSLKGSTVPIASLSIMNLRQRTSVSALRNFGSILDHSAYGAEKLAGSEVRYEPRGRALRRV